MLIPKEECHINKFGIKIRKCCASCKHRLLASDNYRDCDLGERHVKPTYLCPNWDLEQKLDNAGKGSGKVKKKDYLMYIAKYGTGNILEDSKKYEKTNGSRFY